jgi:molybdate transport system substrate-binding protein
VRRIAIPEHAVPVGRYAREWLGSHKLLEILAPRMLQTEHARATLTAVDLGHADVAIVYATDAALARSARVAFEVPLLEQPHILYVAAPLAESRSLPLARRFVEFLASDSAQRVLGAAGFASAPKFDSRDRGSPE